MNEGGGGILALLGLGGVSMGVICALKPSIIVSAAGALVALLP